MPSRSSMLQHHHVHELLGPRPAPLKVATATANQVLVSNKMKRRRPEQQQKARQPVIIYVESPKVVHAHPSEFKSVVQRLTGAPPPPVLHHHHHQFPFQVYEQLVGRKLDDRTTTLPLLVSTGLLPPTVLAADAALQSLSPSSSLRPADAASYSSLIGFFRSTGDDDQLPRPEAAALLSLFDHHSNDMVTVAATTCSSTSNHQLATLLVSAADPFLPPLPSSLGASYHGGGDLFVNQ